MKKVLLVSVAFMLSLFIASNAQAQVKAGSFDEESVLGLFPGLQEKVDSILQQYVNDSLRTEYDFELEQYTTKDSLYKKDSATKSASWKAQMKKEIAQHFYKIQNWQQYQQNMLQRKQEVILYPYKQKVYIALEEIIKEQKYTHVFKSEVFVYAQQSDNLSIKVARKLKLPLPKEVEEAIKAEEAAKGGTTAPANKPAAGGSKPAPKKN